MPRRTPVLPKPIRRLSVPESAVLPPHGGRESVRVAITRSQVSALLGRLGTWWPTGEFISLSLPNGAQVVPLAQDERPTPAREFALVGYDARLRDAHAYVYVPEAKADVCGH